MAGIHLLHAEWTFSSAAPPATDRPLTSGHPVEKSQFQKQQIQFGQQNTNKCSSSRKQEEATLRDGFAVTSMPHRCPSACTAYGRVGPNRSSSEPNGPACHGLMGGMAVMRRPQNGSSRIWLASLFLRVRCQFEPGPYSELDLSGRWTKKEAGFCVGGWSVKLMVAHFDVTSI